MPNLLYPIEWAVAAILAGAHWALTALGLPEDSGWTWVLSILVLVILVRLLMIPLMLKQIRSSRKMQLLAPELKKIQAKYKGKKDQASMQAQQAETMELYRKNGTNPFASCLPMLVQLPILFGLFRVLNTVDEIAAGAREPIGYMTRELAGSFNAAKIFAAPLSDSFLHDSDLTGKIVSLVLIVLMTAFTFFSMKMMMDLNMPDSAKEGPMGQSQTIMLYVLPIILAITGVNFPIGVLVYWTFTNLWSFFQQLFVIRHMPTPNTEAERRMHARQIAAGKEPKRLTLATADSGAGATALGDGEPARGRKGAGGGGALVNEGVDGTSANASTVDRTRLAQGGTGGQRAQPVRRKKSKKKSKKRKKG